MRRLQHHIHYFLNTSRTGNILIIVLILVSIALITLETEFQDSALLMLLTNLIIIFFAGEYLARIWIAPLQFPKNKHPRRSYIFSFAGIIDLAAFLPALIVPFASSSMFLRLLRLTRLIQIMKIPSISQGVERLKQAVKIARMDLTFSICISMGMIFFGAVLMYFVEGQNNPEAFGSIPRALWWSMATLTTVGYGDVYPESPQGRMVASFVALIGIMAVAMPAGILSSAYSSLQTTDPETIAKEEPKDMAETSASKRDPAN